MPEMAYRRCDGCDSAVMYDLDDPDDAARCINGCDSDPSASQ